MTDDSHDAITVTVVFLAINTWHYNNIIIIIATVYVIILSYTSQVVLTDTYDDVYFHCPSSHRS